MTFIEEYIFLIVKICIDACGFSTRALKVSCLPLGGHYSPFFWCHDYLLPCGRLKRDSRAKQPSSPLTSPLLIHFVTHSASDGNG